MFDRHKIDLTRMLPPTSKMTLKMSCIAACKNNVAEADKLYDFFMKDITDLPDFDTPKPTVLQQVRAGADDLFGWLSSHQDDLAKGWNMIQAIRGGSVIETPAAPPADVPPLPQQ